MKEGREPKYPEKTPDDELQICGRDTLCLTLEG